MSLPSLPFRSPLSVVIDYFTNGDSSGEPMTMTHRTRFRGQCGSGSGGATEDVARGILGSGEQEGSSSSRNPAGVGTVTMEEAEDMVPLGEVPLDDVLGLGHGRGNYSSDLQQVAKWMEQIIPFSLLLFLVIVRQHWKGFFVTTCVSAVMFMSNEFVKKQTALKGNRRVSVLLGISFVFMLYVICIYWWYRNDDLLYQLAMFPPKATPPFWHTIFIILVNDALMRQAGMAFKCLLLIYYKNRGGQNFGEQGQMLTLVEYTLLLYRALLPTPVWCRFLLNKDSGSLFSSVTTVLYATLKLIFVVDKVHCFLRALKALSKKEAHYGVYATMEQVNAGGGELCTICQEKMHVPILLCCKHMFCEQCVSEWFERERTCPLCRTLVKLDDLWTFGDGSTSLFLQLF